MNIPSTKEERWQIKRLAARACGLHRAEKQALAFIAEAQTMQNGVCNKALKRAEDVGYPVRNIQWGLHGKRRNGKPEYPGLLVRGIVEIVGGHPKGGLAPGGQGLTPSYAINLKVLMAYIPEVDTDPPDKGETKGETMGETFEKRGVTRGVHAQTSSLSSLHSTSHAAASDPKGEPSPTRAKVLDDDGREAQFPRGAEANKCQLSPSPFAFATGSGETRPSLGVVEQDQGDTQCNGNTQTKGAGNENLIEVEVTDHSSLKSAVEAQQPPISRAEEIIRAARQKQIERSATVNEIYRDYKAVFDRLRKEYEDKCNFEPKSFSEDEPHPDGMIFKGGTRKYADNPIYLAMPDGCAIEKALKASAKHKSDAADLYRAMGRETALTAWEHFLVHEDHSTSERVTDDGETFYTMHDVERTWLLHDFVVACGVPISKGERP